MKDILNIEKTIKKIKENSNIELEIFVHGALCVSYSGQCLMSSLIGGRSGNRGKCAQPCRLPYELLKLNSTSKTCILNNKNYQHHPIVPLLQHFHQLF